MNQTIIPQKDRLNKICLCCGTGRSVKYKFSLEGGSTSIYVCNRCALSQREQIKTILERMKQNGQV